MKTSTILLALMLIEVNAYAQHRISGTVTDEANAPLIGVNVSEVGTFYGTTTDADGHYALSVTSPQAALLFSYVGFERQEVGVDGRTTINITLVEGVQLGSDAGFQLLGAMDAVAGRRNGAENAPCLDGGQTGVASTGCQVAEIFQPGRARRQCGIRR